MTLVEPLKGMVDLSSHNETLKEALLSSFLQILKFRVKGVQSHN